MDWSRGFFTEYYITAVDPATWRDINRIEITGGSISRTASGLRHSADVDCTKFDSGSEKWIRIWLVAKQDEILTREALFTGLASVSAQSIDGNKRSYPLECYSVLKPAEDVLLPRGYFVGEGIDCAESIKTLLSVTPAPVVIDDVAPVLKEPVIAESGENHLSMANRVLNTINWRLQISGDGTIHIGPMDLTVKGSFGNYNDVVEPAVQLKADWFSCPNVFRATSGDRSVIARDDNPDSLLSTISRGREVWKEDSNVHLGDHESLEEYAARRLSEEQSAAYSISYDRRYDPGINIGDIVNLDYPGHGLTGPYVVSSQHIDLGFGAKVSEEVVR